MIQLRVIANTGNRKLGAGCAATYRPVGDAATGAGTCPSTCQFLPRHADYPARRGGCYAASGNVACWSRQSADRADHLDAALSSGARFVRLHVSGDFFTRDAATGRAVLDVAYVEHIIKWARAHPAITLWGYTHDAQAWIDAGISPASCPANLHILASCDTDAQEDRARENGWKTARVFNASDTATIDTRRYTLCPHDRDKLRRRAAPRVCSSCRLCFTPAHDRGIAFLYSYSIPRARSGGKGRTP